VSVSNDQIYGTLLEIKQDIGEIRSMAGNAHEFAAAVSKKADMIREDLRKHVVSDSDHGMAGERRGRGMVTTAIVSVLSSVGAAIGIVKVLGGAPR
jgi:hypothetical protein